MNILNNVTGLLMPVKEVAKVLGITQVQVSRLEKQILETMKRKICK